MPTIRNKKREPLSVEGVKSQFPNGIRLHQAEKGLCLISGSSSTDQWWADLSSTIGTEHGRADWDLLQKINKELFGIEPKKQPIVFRA